MGFVIFFNFLSDKNNENAPEPCNADDEQLKTDITNKFNANLYMDIDDLFNVKNSQRQFYTLPNTTVPNNQTEAAKWIWGVPYQYTCKESGLNCYKDSRVTQHKFTAKMP